MWISDKKGEKKRKECICTYVGSFHSFYPAMPNHVTCWVLRSLSQGRQFFVLV